jgi:hypothetical protein
MFRRAGVEKGACVTNLPEAIAPPQAVATLMMERWSQENTGFHERLRQMKLDRAYVHKGRVNAVWTVVAVALIAYCKREHCLAAADLTTAAEWLVHRRPAGLGVHLVTTPLDPAPCRTTRHETRAAIMAARLLARLFREDPDLNPLGHGWLRAWHRFEAVILARPPWRRPPRPPTEPQSS